MIIFQLFLQYQCCYQLLCLDVRNLQSMTGILQTLMIQSFWTNMVWANSADLDQTAPRGASDQGIHCLLFPLHLIDKIL